jgi:polyphosphate kinase
VESLVRIEKESHKAQLQQIIDLSLSDEVASWHLDDVTWSRIDRNSEGKKFMDLQAITLDKYSKEM